MTNRTDTQAAIDGLVAKQGVAGSVTPTSLATERLQVMLDNSAMGDELTKESAIFDRAYSSGTINGASPPFEIALTEQYNDSDDIIKVSNFKITLKAGSKFKIQGFMNCTCDPSGFMDYRFFDATNTAFIGIQGTIILDTNGGNSGSVVQPVAYVDAEADVDIELQWVGGATVNAYYTAVVIQKV